MQERMFCRHCSLLLTSGLNLNAVWKVFAVRPVPAEVKGNRRWPVLLRHSFL